MHEVYQPLGWPYRVLKIIGISYHQLLHIYHVCDKEKINDKETMIAMYTGRFLSGMGCMAISRF